MRRIVYISRSHVGDDPAALDAIVAQASTRNASAGITGILWSSEDAFVQALGGDPNAIEQTMTRIAADPRHSGLEIVCDCSVQSRVFGKWAMIRSNAEPDGTFGTAYLIGYAGRQRSPAAGRVAELLLASVD